MKYLILITTILFAFSFSAKGQVDSAKCEAAFQYINSLNFDDCDSIQKYYQLRLIEKESYISILESNHREIQLNLKQIENFRITSNQKLLNEKLLNEKSLEAKIKKRNRLLIALSTITIFISLI